MGDDNPGRIRRQSVPPDKKLSRPAEEKMEKKAEDMQLLPLSEIDKEQAKEERPGEELVHYGPQQPKTRKPSQRQRLGIRNSELNRIIEEQERMILAQKEVKRRMMKREADIIMSVRLC